MLRQSSAEYALFIDPATWPSFHTLTRREVKMVLGLRMLDSLLGPPSTPAEIFSKCLGGGEKMFDNFLIKVLSISGNSKP